jgi:hypothetical protein
MVCDYMENFVYGLTKNRLYYGSMAENRNCCTFVGSLSFQFSTVSVKWFMGCGKVHLWPYINHVLLWFKAAENWNSSTP